MSYRLKKLQHEKMLMNKLLKQLNRLQKQVNIKYFVNKVHKMHVLLKYIKVKTLISKLFSGFADSIFQSGLTHSLFASRTAS